jgi:hypothetical protein
MSAEARAADTTAHSPSIAPAQGDPNIPTATLSRSTPIEAAPHVTDDASSDSGIRPEPPHQKTAPALASSSTSKTVTKRARHHLSAKAAHRHDSIRQHAATSAPHTVDIAYKRLSAAECAGGAPGLLCREKLRFRLCKQRWSDRDVPGMSVCRVMAHAAPLS